MAEFGDSLCPEGARSPHQSDNFGVGSLVCLEGRGTLFPTPSFITLIKRPRVSTHPANTIPLPAGNDLRLRSQVQLVLVGFLIGCGALQPFSFPGL